MEIDLLIEAWSRLKPFIPAKERTDAADGLVDVFDEFGVLDSLDSVHGLDKHLTVAIKSRHDIGDEEDNEYNL